MNPNRDDNEARLFEIERRLAKLEETPKPPPAPKKPWLKPWLEEWYGAVIAIAMVTALAVGGYWAYTSTDWYKFREAHKCVSGVLTPPQPGTADYYRFLDSLTNCYDCDIGRVCK